MNESAPFPEPVEIAYEFPPSPQTGSPISQNSPDNPPWGVPMALATWFLSVVLLLFAPLVTVIPYVIYHNQRYGSVPSEALLRDKGFIFFSVLGVIPAHLLTLLIAWLVVTSLRRFQFWKMLGWDWPAFFGPWKSVGLALALFAVGSLITMLFGGKETEIDLLINSSYATRVVMAVLAAGTGPLVEEIVYRGVLYSAFQRVIGMTGAVVIVAVMFAGVHVLQYRNNLAVIGVISLLSISLTLVRAYTGRLLPSFIIHFVFNGIQSVYLVLEPFIGKPERVPDKIQALHLALTWLRHLV